MPVEKWSDTVVVVHLGDDPQFTEELDTLERQLSDAQRHVVLDFAAVRYISSTSIARLLKLRKEMARSESRMMLCAVQPHIREVFRITSLEKIFTFSDDVSTALATLQLT